MGNLGCHCCSDKDDDGPKLFQDLKILNRSHVANSGQETPNVMVLTFSESEGMECDLIILALRTYHDRKTIKLLRITQDFEDSAIARLSPDAAKIRKQLGPYGFKEGRPMFRSMQTISPGVSYIGDMGIGDKRPSGRGLLVTADGSISEGYWQNGMLHGKARQIHANGDWYIGDWVNGVMEGKGKLHYSDNHFYEGEWRGGLQHGYAVEEWPDGARFSGQFREGHKDGPGVFYWSDGSKYEGELKKNMLEGRGVYLWGDGKRYEGEWKANKMHGYGKFTWPDGKMFDGNYENDQKNGFGTFTWADGRRYEGGWINNKRHGKGVEYIKGIPFEGVWEHGKKVSAEA